MADVDVRLWDLLESWLGAEGVELDDLQMLGSSAGRIVRVTVDTPGGIDLERIAEVSQGLSRLIDAEGALAGSYTLEVSSPGLERPLRRPAQFRKAVGCEVVVKTSRPISGVNSHRGVLASADDTEVSLVVDGEDRHIPFTDVSQARTVFRWEKPPKPGKRGAR
ncbi:MAG: ribosome maturation factor RimP [Acidimicrobiia bacterium]|nr:MAG: ribosome maturation factor RimP [Acidimicrobiia bacterium]